jgi:hypothetical protein
LVRYEELVRNPVDVVQAACEFLGERYEPTILRFFETVPDHVGDIPCHTKLLTPIDAASVGSFNQMSSDEIAHIEAACREGMEAMGYPLRFPNRTIRSDGAESPDALVSRQKRFAVSSRNWKWWQESYLWIRLFAPNDQEQKYRLSLWRLHWFVRRMLVRLHLRYWLVVWPFQKSH